MPVRRLWVLLVLAAVFSMHGLQCLAGNSALDHNAVPALAASSVGDASTTTHAAGVIAAAASPGTTAAHAALELAAAFSPANLLVSHPPAHDPHLLSAVCLAVLLTGLTILTAVALRRWVAVQFVRGSPSISRSLTGWPIQPRPPDLSALCLLRI